MFLLCRKKWKYCSSVSNFYRLFFFYFFESFVSKCFIFFKVYSYLSFFFCFHFLYSFIILLIYIWFLRLIFNFIMVPASETWPRALAPLDSTTKMLKLIPRPRATRPRLCPETVRPLSPACHCTKLLCPRRNHPLTHSHWLSANLWRNQLASFDSNDYGDGDGDWHSFWIYFTSLSDRTSEQLTDRLVGSRPLSAGAATAAAAAAADDDDGGCCHSCCHSCCCCCCC